MNRTLLGALGGVLVGCGTSAGSVEGAVAGQTLSAEDSITYTLGSTTVIGIDSVPNLCSYAQKNELPKNLVSLAFYLSPTVSAPGTFVIDQTSVTAIWVVRDATCAGTSVDATSGSIAITSVTTTVNGTFDVMFNQDHLTGRFAATSCDHSQDASPTCI